MMSPTPTNEIEVIISLSLLLLLSAFFSGAETAFTALSVPKVQLFIEQKRWGWKKIQFLSNNLDRCIMSCLIMSNLVNIIMSAYLTVIATSWFGLGKGLTIAVGIGTALILLFGEIVPKKIAIQYTEKFTQSSAHILWGTMILLSPLTFPIMKVIDWIWPRKISAKGDYVPNVSEDEIRAMVKLGEISGALNKSSQEFLQRIFTLPKKQARDIMTPLAHIISASNTLTIAQLRKVFQSNHFSRIPIYDQHITDGDIRLAYMPSFVPLWGDKANHHTAISTLNLPKIMKIPESFIIQDLLAVFQDKHQHMALVVNENQNTIGIITMEDILEVVFGEIEDESHKALRTKVLRNKKHFDILGDMSLNDFATQTQQIIPKKFPPHKTIAWLCMELLHRFPQPKDHIQIPGTNIVLTVQSTEKQKAQKISVRIVTPLA